MSYEPRMTDRQPPSYTPSESITGIPARPPVLATDHSAHTTRTDSTTAALSHAANNALDNAARARTVLHRRTLEYVARLIREALPDATTITADTEAGELHEVRDGNGKTLFHTDDRYLSTSPLTDSYADDIDHLLAEAFPFGGLLAAGWEVAAEGEPYRSVTLPTVDVTGRRTAATSFPTPRGMASIRAEYHRGATAAIQITDNPASPFVRETRDQARETRDRIRAAIVNSDLGWEPGAMDIAAEWPALRFGSASDLAFACTALAAAGAFDPAALNGVVLIGELGLDGRVRYVEDVTALIRTAQTAGYRKFIVAADDFDEASQNEDVTVVGANNLAAAVDFLEEMHADTTTPADEARPHGTPGEDAGPCAQCEKPLIWDGTGNRLHDEWGECICTGPKTASSNVHVLAK
ncbi:magnesium chelatase domain-containing protein [Streptomyces griseofuscus]|uniref:magnesium chelatase domain-containing protein n=1 Tax=Streptomyces griseofuscus TaxID=146922 RepID=UPI00340FAF32